MKIKRNEEMPDGCFGILLFGVIGGIFGFGFGLFMFSFLQDVGLSIMTSIAGGFVGFFIGEYLGRK